jgi:putative ABC transport system permease protein
MEDKMLEIKNVTKIYKTGDFTQKALDNVSIKFRNTEFVSILGPSGSGKTTLLNIIGGLDHYTNGDLIISGVSTKNYKDHDWDIYRNRKIGFVFQSYNLISHQSVLSNVELALTLSGVSKEERTKRAKKALKSVGLEQHMHKKPNQLSGGQMQRVAIARALVNDPEIVLADEPTGALDTKTSIQIMKILKEISKEKLVIMVTHNPELAKNYSTRIVSLTDGKIVDDTNAYNGEKEESNKHKKYKTHMSFLTALSLSLNNLMTKKGRTLLTSFAGSIGIIGIALILSLSNGIQNYITKTEKETLGSYPLTIQKASIDMSSMLTSFMGTDTSEYDDDLIHQKNIMGNMFESISSDVQSNDLKSFKEYIESNKTNINDYVTSIQYGYNLTLNLYKADTDNITRVNPTTVLDTLGMGTSGVSSVYSSMMSNYDVFTELIDNDDYNKEQYELISGSWPTNYNEVVLIVTQENEISDYTLYTLGILDQSELKEQFNNMVSGKEVSFETHSYNPDDLLNTTFKLVKTVDYYKKENGIWIDKSDDTTYMKKLLDNAEDIKIVGIVRPGSESVVGNNTYGLVGYTHALTEHIIEETNNSKIVKEQLDNPNINVFTGQEFSSTSFDINNLTKEQLTAISKMSETELAEYIQTINEYANTTYEQNLQQLGICDIDDPDYIYIYPKDFDSKDEIVNIINKYNEGKTEDEKLQYTDTVGIMMKSVSSIVNVISSVLIAFVAISLIVSSIMIAIITYISVMERTKEIGILRAIGASKKDISRVFNAETLIEGLVAGIMGILITLLINIPINIIIKNNLNISNIASLPIVGAIILIIISVLLTIIAGLIPSRMASKKDPVEALRTE